MPFNIYFCFQSVLKKIHSDDKNNTSYTKKVVHILCTFFFNVVCADDKFRKPVVLYKGKNAVDKFIEAILKENEYCKKMIKSILIKILSCL